MGGLYDAESSSVTQSVERSPAGGRCIDRSWFPRLMPLPAAGQAGVIDAATIAAEREYVDFTLPDLE